MFHMFHMLHPHVASTWQCLLPAVGSLCQGFSPSGKGSRSQSQAAWTQQGSWSVSCFIEYRLMSHMDQHRVVYDWSLHTMLILEISSQPDCELKDFMLADCFQDRQSVHLSFLRCFFFALADLDKFVHILWHLGQAFYNWSTMKFQPPSLLDLTAFYRASLPDSITVGLLPEESLFTNLCNAPD